MPVKHQVNDLATVNCSMLSPVALSTWIAFCVPWAEPRLAAALVAAGSAGEPYLVVDANDQKFVGKTPSESVRFIRKRTAKPTDTAKTAADTLYIGLTQIPSFALRELGIDPEIALDKCSNLEIGYSIFLAAYSHAQTVEKSPWKTTSVAYNFFRNRQSVIDTPYAKRATDYLMQGTVVSPAGMNDPIYHAVVAEWSAGLAARHAMRIQQPGPSLLAESSEITQWARKKY